MSPLGVGGWAGHTVSHCLCWDISEQIGVAQLQLSSSSAPAHCRPPGSHLSGPTPHCSQSYSHFHGLSCVACEAVFSVRPANYDWYHPATAATAQSCVMWATIVPHYTTSHYHHHHHHHHLLLLVDSEETTQDMRIITSLLVTQPSLPPTTPSHGSILSNTQIVLLPLHWFLWISKIFSCLKIDKTKYLLF